MRWVPPPAPLRTMRLHVHLTIVASAFYHAERFTAQLRLVSCLSLMDRMLEVEQPIIDHNSISATSEKRDRRGAILNVNWQIDRCTIGFEDAASGSPEPSAQLGAAVTIQGAMGTRDTTLAACSPPSIEEAGRELLSSVAGDHLTHHHGRHGREQGDAQGREGALALGYRQGGDHTGPEAGHGELGGEFAAGAGAGARGHGGFISVDRQTLRAMNRSSPPPPPSCYQAWLFFIKPLHRAASMH